MPNNFLRLLYSWANFSLMAELVSWGNNLKTKIKMPDGNISSQSKAVRHFGHWVSRFGQCSLFYSEVETASTRKIKLPVLSAVLADSILLRLVAACYNKSCMTFHRKALSRLEAQLMPVPPISIQTRRQRNLKP